MAAGSLKYVVTLRFTSDFDGVLAEPAPGETASDALGAAARMSAGALEAQVDETRAFLVCPPCRRRMLEDPLGRGSLRPGTGVVQ